jgi:tripeptidyl-peptidase I
MKAVLVFVALVALAAALPTPARTIRAHACNFQENCGVHDYKIVGRANGASPQSVTLWTSQNGMIATCPSMLMEVSDPDSPKYGHHVSFEQMKALVFDEAALAAIADFLDQAGVPESQRTIAPNGDYVTITAPISLLETMFSAEFYVFSSMERHATVTRSAEYTIPAELSAHVTIVAGISNFPVYRRGTEIHSLTLDRQGGGVIPSLIYSTYRLPNETDSTPKANMGVFEALGQSYSDDDLAQFQQTYGLPRTKVAKIIGPNDGSSCQGNPNNCVEAELDVEYIMAMAQGAPLTYWSIKQENGDIFLDWIQQVSKVSNPPQVFSISYGGPEHLQNQPDMTLFANEVCKMGLRGMTIFVASGDDGVAGYEARSDPSKCGFFPEYPACVPYVTTVGATMGPETNNPEVVCQSNAGSIITSGGGFSAHFTQPSYQTQAVATYLSTGPNLPPKNLFKSGGRGYPDVGSLGNAYNVVIGGQTYQVSGTSAASPVFCGMVTLVNGDRETKGKNPLGFLNPVLYKVDKSVYNDIVSGENNCCAGQGNPVCCQYGFTASKGWDPCTGFGSLDYPLFANALASLP